MQAVLLKRKFYLKIDDRRIELDDINPLLSIDEIRDMHSTVHPELLNSKLIELGPVGEYLNYEFVTVAGTKG